MARHVAFLRGMNLGKRRIKNDELCAAFREMGFAEVSAFLASGNVVFSVPQEVSLAGVTERVEGGLRESLGYEVPTFLRTAEEVTEIARREIFSVHWVASGGKVQVAFLATEPTSAARREVLQRSTEADRLALEGRELFWLPRGRLTDSELDLKALETLLGPMTIRTKRTVDRLADRFFC